MPEQTNEHNTSSYLPAEKQIENGERGEITNTLPLVPQLSVALGILVLIFGASYLPPFFENTPSRESRISDGQNAASAGTSLEEQAAALPPVALEARSAYVWDVRNQKALYNKNASAQLPLASITKLMTVLVAAKHLDDTSSIRIGLDAIRQDGESGLTDGTAFAFESLADFTLMTSSNDGAFALATAAGTVLNDSDVVASPTETFVREMNKTAEEIGLSQTYFTNPTGLDRTEQESGSYGSARDMAFLMEHIVTDAPEIFERTNRHTQAIRDLEGTLYTAENTNTLARDIPGLIASKTGYTDLAGGNLVLAFDAGLNHPIIISVLGSTREGRFADAEALVSRVQEILTGPRM